MFIINDFYFALCLSKRSLAPPGEGRVRPPGPAKGQSSSGPHTTALMRRKCLFRDSVTIIGLPYLLGGLGLSHVGGRGEGEVIQLSINEEKIKVMDDEKEREGGGGRGG